MDNNLSYDGDFSNKSYQNDLTDNNDNLNINPFTSKQKFQKDLKLIRDLSISVIVFTSLWIIFIVMGICFWLFQVGFAEKYSTVNLELPSGKLQEVNTGIELATKFRLFSSLKLTPDQEYWYSFYMKLWISLVSIAVIMFVADNVLLIVIKEKTNGENFPENNFLSSALSVLFKITGVVLIFSTFAMLFDFFSDFDEGWLILVAIVLFILIVCVIIGIAIITNTFLSLGVSSYMVHKSRKESKELNLNI